VGRVRQERESKTLQSEIRFRKDLLVKILPNALKTELIKLQNASPWFFLFEIKVNDAGQYLFLVKNTSDVVFDGKTYKPWPITLSEIRTDLKGSLYGITIDASNILTSMFDLLDTGDNFMEQPVTIRLVHGDNLTDATAVTSETFRVASIESTETSARFTLDHFNFFDIPRPIARFNNRQCRYVFKDAQCKYTASTSTTCDKTLNDHLTKMAESSPGDPFLDNARNISFNVFRADTHAGLFPFIPRRYDLNPNRNKDSDGFSI